MARPETPPSEVEARATRGPLMLGKKFATELALALQLPFACCAWSQYMVEEFCCVHAVATEPSAKQAVDSETTDPTFWVGGELQLDVEKSASLANCLNTPDVSLVPAVTTAWSPQSL